MLLFRTVAQSKKWGTRESKLLLIGLKDMLNSSGRNVKKGIVFLKYRGENRDMLTNM